MLRHLNASLLLRQGIQPHVVQKHHGHANVRTTLEVYGHLLDNAYEQAADTEALEKALAAKSAAT
jgi:site-specific recombinase XerD